MDDVQFGVAGTEDIPELIRLRIAYIAEDLGSVTESEKQSMEAQLPGYFERKLNKELFAFVARAEGCLVAAAYLLIVEKPASPAMPNGRVGEVLSVYTEKAYRGRGLCSRLMQDLIECAGKHDLCRIDLAATEEGYPVYKRAGFEETAQKYTEMRMKL